MPMGGHTSEGWAPAGISIGAAVSTPACPPPLFPNYTKLRDRKSVV